MLDVSSHVVDVKSLYRHDVLSHFVQLKLSIFPQQTCVSNMCCYNVSIKRNLTPTWSQWNIIWPGQSKHKLKKTGYLFDSNCPCILVLQRRTSRPFWHIFHIMMCYPVQYEGGLEPALPGDHTFSFGGGLFSKPSKEKFALHDVGHKRWVQNGPGWKTNQVKMQLSQGSHSPQSSVIADSPYSFCLRIELKCGAQLFHLRARIGVRTGAGVRSRPFQLGVRTPNSGARQQLL